MIRLVRDSITHINADAICYGAKDNGEMGGGAAAAIVLADGPQVISDAKRVITPNSRVGDVFYSEAHLLSDKLGVKCIIHLISIIKYTPQGSYCPKPENIRSGVMNALTLAKKLGCQSIAFSAMGTGNS